MKKDNKLFRLVDNVLTYSNSYCKLHMNESGKVIYSESSVSDLTRIVGEVLKLNNHIVETGQYKDNPAIMDCLSNIADLHSKIQITESNAKRLDVKKALNYWENIHNYGLTLAILIAEDKEYFKEDE